MMVWLFVQRGPALSVAIGPLMNVPGPGNRAHLPEQVTPLVVQAVLRPILPKKLFSQTNPEHAKGGNMPQNSLASSKGLTLLPVATLPCALPGSTLVYQIAPSIPVM
jgi:hypothetical protein